MRTSNSNLICEQAQLYYYDYLGRNVKGHIPAEISTHISQCDFCQHEIDRLKIVLAEVEECTAESSGQTKSIITANLGLHFVYAGVLVTCNTIKPFLPSLADPTFEFGIPTPITVHLDKCQQCANDLETIWQLHLTHKQLCRLGQLFAEKPNNAISCSQAQTDILAVALMALHETNAENLKHLCTCPNCREILYDYREKVLDDMLHNQKPPHEFPYDAVSASDIFDYCIPYGIDPATDQYAKCRPAFTSNASVCATCFSKIQKLHKTIYGILERDESEIVTFFEVCKPAQESVVCDSDDVYAEWPIEVRAFDKSKESDIIEMKELCETEVVEAPNKSRVEPSFPSLRRFIKPVAAAAAVLLIVILLLNIPAAKAVDLNQIYKAFEQIKNIYITTFVPEKSKPTQEIWVSQALNIKLFKTETECVLWDVNDKLRKARDLNLGPTVVTRLSEDMLDIVKGTIEEQFGLLPFSHISEVSKDATWQRIDDKTIETTITGTQVYDLVWTQKELTGKIIYRKWRGFIDIETKLPRRIEWWEKLDKDDKYRLTGTSRITYPDTIEIQTVIRDVGF